MAKQKGIIKIKGTLNGLCYYKLNGVDIIRKATGPSKNRIQNDPAFVKVKGNNQEFAAAVYLSKAIVMGLGSLAKTFKDSYMQSRLTGVCLNIIKKEAGMKGQRDANLLNNPESLIGFPLHKEKLLNKVITAIPQVTTNTERNKVTITLHKDGYKNLSQLQKKGNIIFTVAVCLVSPFQWNKTQQMYQPKCPDQNGLGFKSESKVNVFNLKSQEIQLHVAANTIPDNHVSVTVWLGLSLVETTQKKQDEAQLPHSMQCIAVL